MNNGGKWLDAYAHIGWPRFGNLAQALQTMDWWGIEKAVLVLGPLLPDYSALFEAAANHADRVRCIGIPFGETEDQRCEITETALSGGAIGLRMERRELLANPRILTMLGERGRWIYATGAEIDPDKCGLLLDWLRRYPQGRVAAPHFLRAGKEAAAELSRGAAAELLSHSRFYPIFSRHGGMGSAEAYPHRDYLPWIKTVAAAKGWSNILWGSEYPVFYWRNETRNSVQGWISELDLGLSASELADFAGANTERLFFDEPAPQAEKRELPGWVEAQIPQGRTVALLPNQPLEMPMDLYGKLWNAYMKSELYREGRPLEQFLIRKLSGDQDS